MCELFCCENDPKQVGSWHTMNLCGGMEVLLASLIVNLGTRLHMPYVPVYCSSLKRTMLKVSVPGMLCSNFYSKLRTMDKLQIADASKLTCLLNVHANWTFM